MKILFILAAVAAASALPVSKEEGFLSSFVSALRDCLEGDVFVCLKEKALSYTEKVVNSRELTPIDGITFANTGSARTSRSYEPLASDPKLREHQIDDRIVDNVQDFLDDFVVQLRMPKSYTDDGSLEEEGRGKKKKKIKKLLPLLALLKIKLAALIPLFLGIIAFVVVKAFLLGKIAFIATALGLLKKLLDSKKHQGWAEPAHEEHGWESGGGGWGRASNVPAQDLAYSAHAKQA